MVKWIFLICFIAASAAANPRNGLEIYEVSPWLHRHPTPMVTPDEEPPWAPNAFAEIKEVQGNTEVVGFVLRHPAGIQDLNLIKHPVLAQGCGSLASEFTDIRVATQWNQAQYSWVDIGIVPATRFIDKLIPELLLHDSSLVDARSNGKNFVGGIHVNPEEIITGRTIVPGDQRDFVDSQTSIDIPPNTNVWVWYSIDVPLETDPCPNYIGRVSLRTNNINYGKFKVKMEIVDAVTPKVGHQLAYYRGQLSPGSDVVGPDVKNEVQLLAELKELHRAGIDPIVYQPPQTLGSFLGVMRQAGYTGSTLHYLGVSTNAFNSTPESIESLLFWARNARETAAQYGFTDIWIYGNDEAHAAQINHKPKYDALRADGFTTFVADHEADYGIKAMMGDSIDVLIDAEHPRKAHSAIWPTILSYANRQSAVEDPYVVRRNYGVLLWAQGYDGFGVYAAIDCSGNCWNDNDGGDTLRDAALMYPTRTAPFRTIQLEAMREAVEDYYLLKAVESVPEAAPWLDALKASITDEMFDPSGKTINPNQLNLDLINIRNQAIEWLTY